MSVGLPGAVDMSQLAEGLPCPSVSCRIPPYHIARRGCSPRSLSASSALLGLLSEASLTALHRLAAEGSVPVESQGEEESIWGPFVETFLMVRAVLFQAVHTGSITFLMTQVRTYLPYQRPDSCSVSGDTWQVALLFGTCSLAPHIELPPLPPSHGSKSPWCLSQPPGHS